MSRRFSLSNTFSALKYRNYRLWFCGQTVSLFGSWMQTTAQGYLVFQLTHSSAYLGYVSFVAGIPTWLFMLYAGVVADRVPRRTLLVITQSYMMMLAFVLATLTFLDIVRPWHIMLLAFMLGIAHAFDAPARLAFVREMVEHEDLTNAIALNAAMFNSAMATGPAIAGVTYALFGPAWCFTINGISFIGVIGALLLMKLTPQNTQSLRAGALADLKEGLRYAVSHPLIRALIALVGMIGLFGMSFMTLIPAWAVKVLGGDARTNGLLQSARGVGALCGALLIASLGRFRFKGKLLSFGTFAFPSMLLVFTSVRQLPLSLVVLVGVGAASIFVLNMANALVQTIVADSLRGRVMSVYSFIHFGSMPIGALWVGSIAEHINEPTALVVNSLITLCIAGLVWKFVPKLRALQ